MDKMNYVMDDPQYGFSAWWHQNEEYDDHYDHTSNWLVLQAGASLKDAVAALAEEGKQERYALRIESDVDFGAEQEEILQVCRDMNLMLLREEHEGCFFNYCDGREYEIHEMTGYGSADDAASIIDRSLNMALTAEEKAAQEEEFRHRRRQMKLAKGKEICRKRLIRNVRRVDRELKQLRGKLEEQVEKDPDIKTVPYRERDDVFRKQLQLRQQIGELETAREYLLHREELEEK